MMPPRDPPLADRLNRGSSPPPHPPTEDRGYPTHLYGVNDNAHDGQASFCSATGWANSVSAVPAIDFPEPFVGGDPGDRGDQTGNWAAPPAPFRAVSAARHNGSRQGRPDPLSSDEVVVPCHPAVSTPLQGSVAESDPPPEAYSISSVEGGDRDMRCCHRYAKAATRRLCSLTAWLALAFAVILLLPIAGIAPLSAMVYRTTQQSAWESVHLSHITFYEAYLDAYSNFVSQFAISTGRIFTREVFDPEETGILSLTCDFLTRLQSVGGVESISVSSLTQPKQAICATDHASPSQRRGPMVGYVSHNGSIGGIYLINATTFEFVEPPVVVSQVPSEYRNLSHKLAPVYMQNRAVQELVRLFENGDWYATTPPRLSWWDGGLQNTVFFTYPFLAYSTRGDLEAERFTDVGIVEVKADATVFTHAPHINANSDSVRVALLSPNANQSCEPSVISNNWGQPVQLDSEGCLWRWCAKQKTLLYLSGITDDYMKAALQHLDLTFCDSIDIAEVADSSLRQTVSFLYEGAYMTASAWVHVTPSGLPYILVLTSVQRPVTGPFYTRRTCVISVAYGISYIVVVTLFGLFVQFALTRPLREVADALMAGQAFEEDARLQGSGETRRQHRTMNPLHTRSRLAASDVVDKEGDSYRNVELKRRVSVINSVKILHLSEIQELRETYNLLMERLRTADTFMPQATAVVEQIRCLATTSTPPPSEGREEELTHAPETSRCGSRDSSSSGGGGRASNCGTPARDDGTEVFEVPPKAACQSSGKSTPSLGGTSTTRSSTHNGGSSTSHGCQGETARSTLSYVEGVLSLVSISLRDRDAGQSSSTGAARELDRSSADSGKHGSFPSAFGLEYFFTSISKFAERFGGVIFSMTPEMAKVVFNTQVLAIRNAAIRAPNTFVSVEARQEMEAKAAALDAVAAVRFALALQRCFKRGSRLVPATQMMVDTSLGRLSHYESSSKQQHFLFVETRDVYKTLNHVLSQLCMPVALTEETALLVWRDVRCIPVEAIRLDEPLQYRACTQDTQALTGGGERGPTNSHHIILYEALCGSAQSAPWCQYRDSYAAAFLPMLHGDYARALGIFLSISTIVGLDAPLRPAQQQQQQQEQHASESELLSTGDSDRGRRHRSPATVTWKDITLSHTDTASAGGTKQLDRMTAICARNVEKGITLPYVHTVTVSGYIKASPDLEDTLPEITTTTTNITLLDTIAAKKKRRRTRRRMEAPARRRCCFTLDGLVTKTSHPRSLVGAALRSVPRTVEDGCGLLWKLSLGLDHDELTEAGYQRDLTAATSRHRMLTAFSPTTGAIASVELRLLSEMPTMPTGNTNNGSTTLANVNRDRSDEGSSCDTSDLSITSAPATGDCAGVAEAEDGATPTLRAADPAVVSCPYLYHYLGHLICQPTTTNILLLLGEYHHNDTLSEYMKRFGRALPINFVVSVSLSTLRGLAYLHSCGRVHGDLRPENILLSTSTHLVRVPVPAAAAPATTTSSGTTKAPQPVLKQEHRIGVRLKGYVLAGTEGRYTTAGSAYAPPRNGTRATVIAAAGEGPPLTEDAKDCLIEPDTVSWDLFGFGLVLLTMLRQRLRWEAVASPPVTPQNLPSSGNSGEEEEEGTEEWLARLVAKGGGAFAREVGRGAVAPTLMNCTTRSSRDSLATPNADTEVQMTERLASLALQCISPASQKHPDRVCDALRAVEEVARDLKPKS